MTATPHSGSPKLRPLHGLLELRPRSPAGCAAEGPKKEAGARDMMRRLSKEQLRHMDGRPLFPERRAYAVKFALSQG